MLKMPFWGLTLLLVSLFAGGCDDGDETNIASTATSESIVPIDCAGITGVTTVNITSAGFSPQSVSVSTVPVVNWINTDSVPHSVISGIPPTGDETTGDGTSIGDGTGAGTDDDGGGIIGGIGGSPGLIGPIITVGALFDSGPLAPGQSFCLDFSNLKVGDTTDSTTDTASDTTLFYHCEIHPAETGRITIAAPAVSGQ